jgi:hypothetical protein
MVSLIDPCSRALAGSYSESSNSGSDEEDEEFAMEATAETQEHNPKHRNTGITASSLLLPNKTDYLDFSGFTPPPPSSDSDEKPCLSLSHTGTLGKRNRATSPDQLNNKKEFGERQTTPDINCYVSILERNRRVNHWDVKLSDDLKNSTMPDALSADLSHQFTSKPAPDTSKALESERPRSMSLDPRSFAPRGPRALTTRPLVCFFWYHKGKCTPRRRDGRIIDCTFAHSVVGPNPQVSLPPVLNGHKPDCSLPLCPVRVARSSPEIARKEAKAVTESVFKNEPTTPAKRDAVDTCYSSSPRDGIAEARYFVSGPKFNGNPNFQQLPKLTGAKRERFKAQRRIVERWQMDNDSQLFDAAKHDMDKMEMKRLKKQQKAERRLKRQSTKNTVLNYGDTPAKDPNAHATAISAKRHSKKNKRYKLRSRARNLLKTDAAERNSPESLAMKAKLCKESLQPTASYKKHAPAQDTPKEMEDRQQGAMTVNGTIQSLEHSSRLGLSGATLSAIGETDQLRKESSVPKETGLEIQGRTMPKALVDYELPMGEARLEWDTDIVRRLFGEIE